MIRSYKNKNLIRPNSEGQNILILPILGGRPLTICGGARGNQEETFQKAFSGKNDFQKTFEQKKINSFFDFSSAPPPQIINGRPLNVTFFLKTCRYSVFPIKINPALTKYCRMSWVDGHIIQLLLFASIMNESGSHKNQPAARKAVS